MPPKIQFTKEQLIDAAFEIARKEGLNSISIRKVADRLGSSIAPIYVNFQHVEELKQAVIQKITEISQQLLEEQNSGNPFLDIGVASLRFAHEYPVLFRDLVMIPNTNLETHNQTIDPILIQQMRMDPELSGFNDEELGEILLKMRIFQMGLSVMIANRLLSKDFKEEKAVAILHSTAGDVITSTRLRKNKMKKGI